MHYYQVGDETTISAIEAWDKFHRNRRIKHTTFELVLFNGEFDKFNWLSQPRSITELEEIRARQLVNKHKKLRLLYSGGSDSFSVAHAFARIGHPIDEYVFFEYVYMDSESYDSLGYTKTKKNILENLHSDFGLPPPNVRITTLDKSLLDNYYTSDKWYEGNYGYSGTQGFSVSVQPDIVYVKNNEDDFTTIVGMEKPRVFKDELGYYWQMNDKNTLYGASTKHDHDWFYMSPDLPELILAQTKSVINVSRETLVSLGDLQTNKEYYDLWCKSLGRRSTTWQNNMSALAKNIGFSVPTKMTTSYYRHIPEADLDSWTSWQRYKKYVNLLKEVTQSESPDGVNTKKYYVELTNAF